MIPHVTRQSRRTLLSRNLLPSARTTTASRSRSLSSSTPSPTAPPGFTEQQHSDLSQNNNIVDPTLAANAPSNLELADARGNYLEDADLDFNEALPTMEDRHKRYREEFGVDMSAYMRKTPMMSMDSKIKLPKLNKRAIERKKAEWEAQQKVLASRNQSGSYAAQRARYQRLRQQFAKPPPTPKGDGS